MSLLIEGLSMPKKPTTLYVQPDGRVWIMNGGERKLKAVEVKEPHGNLIDRDVLLDSFRETVQKCEKWMEEVKDDEETLPYARQAYCSFVEAKLRTFGMPVVVEEVSE